jgi:sodium-dependent dicarboxylate transporter 2/3/5
VISARRFGLVLGPALLLAVELTPDSGGMPPAAKSTAGVMALMAAWWLTEAIPLAATALVPVVVLPLLGAMDAAEISLPYANKTNFLFLGGLMLATAIERWGLHRRIALHVLARAGEDPARIVLGFMVATAAISAWISNAATTMMMLPIALAVSAQITHKSVRVGEQLTPVLMLAVAYAATIGGLATVVGTPPNAVAVGSLAQMFPAAPAITFIDWMKIGVPIVIVLIPGVWLYLVRIASSLWRAKLEDAGAVVRRELADLGPMTRPERRVLAAFSATAVLWFFLRSVDLGPITIPGWSSLTPVPSRVDDSTVAIGMALLLFCVPAGDGSGSRLLDWESAVRLPWAVVLLLGGGFALAEATLQTGLAAWAGSRLDWVTNFHPLLAIFAVVLTVSFATEFMNNTAIATMLMPILAASAVSAGYDPRLLMVPAALAASLAFMMPNATAPNAIVFASGRLRVAFMARVGIAANLAGVALVTILTYAIALPTLGIEPGRAPTWAIPPTQDAPVDSAPAG